MCATTGKIITYGTCTAIYAIASCMYGSGFGYLLNNFLNSRDWMIIKTYIKKNINNAVSNMVITNHEQLLRHSTIFSAFLIPNILGSFVLKYYAKNKINPSIEHVWPFFVLTIMAIKIRKILLDILSNDAMYN